MGPAGDAGPPARCRAAACARHARPAQRADAPARRLPPPPPAGPAATVRIVPVPRAAAAAQQPSWDSNATLCHPLGAHAAATGAALAITLDLNCTLPDGMPSRCASTSTLDASLIPVGGGALTLSVAPSILVNCSSSAAPGAPQLLTAAVANATNASAPAVLVLDPRPTPPPAALPAAAAAADPAAAAAALAAAALAAASAASALPVTAVAAAPVQPPPAALPGPVPAQLPAAAALPALPGALEAVQAPLPAALNGAAAAQGLPPPQALNGAVPSVSAIASAATDEAPPAAPAALLAQAGGSKTCVCTFDVSAGRACTAGS